MHTCMCKIVFFFFFVNFKPGHNCHWTGKLWVFSNNILLITSTSAVRKLNIVVVFFQSAAKFLNSTASPRQEEELIL